MATAQLALSSKGVNDAMFYERKLYTLGFPLLLMLVLLFNSIMAVVLHTLPNWNINNTSMVRHNVWLLFFLSNRWKLHVTTKRKKKA